MLQDNNGTDHLFGWYHSNTFKDSLRIFKRVFRYFTRNCKLFKLIDEFLIKIYFYGAVREWHIKNCTNFWGPYILTLLACYHLKLPDLLKVSAPHIKIHIILRTKKSKILCDWKPKNSQKCKFSVQTSKTQTFYDVHSKNPVSSNRYGFFIQKKNKRNAFDIWIQMFYLS